MNTYSPSARRGQVHIGKIKDTPARRKARIDGAKASRREQKALDAVTAKHKTPELVTASSRTILNKAITKQFVSLLARGLGMGYCCDYLGINHGTFWEWRRKGELFNKDDEDQFPQFRIYGRFVKAIRKAIAAYALHLTEELHTSGGKRWIKPLAILERRDRENYGKIKMEGGTDEEYNPDEKFL